MHEPLNSPIVSFCLCFRLSWTLQFNSFLLSLPVVMVSGLSPCMASFKVQYLRAETIGLDCSTQTLCIYHPRTMCYYLETFLRTPETVSYVRRALHFLSLRSIV